MAAGNTRIDKYLWSIRIFKTRSLAAEACQKGRVKCNGNAVKASKVVITGDQYEIKTESRRWVIRVTDILDHRVDYQTSLNYYLDETPEELNLNKQSSAFVFNTGKRKSKQGRPTKKDMRDLENAIREIRGLT